MSFQLVVVTPEWMMESTEEKNEELIIPGVFVSRKQTIQPPDNSLLNLSRRCCFHNNYRLFLCHTEMLNAFKLKDFQKRSFRGRSTPTQKKIALIYAFNNCASLPLQSGLSCSLISCRSAVLEWWHFQWAGTPLRPCIQLWVPRSRKGNAEIHQDRLRNQLSVWFPSPPSACVPAPGSFKSHLIWSLWGFN